MSMPCMRQMRDSTWRSLVIVIIVNCHPSTVDGWVSLLYGNVYSHYTVLIRIEHSQVVP